MILQNILTQQYNSMANWVSQTPVPKIIDSVTYDTYESNNPFRINYFTDKQIENKYLHTGIKTAQYLGAEAFSIYTNPFYLTHKIVNLPTNYQNIVNSYKQNSLKE